MKIVKIEKQPDKVIFYLCLALAIALLVGSFFCPPMGVIDGSILKAVAELLGFAALGIIGANLYRGKDVKFHHGDTEVTIGDLDDEKK